MFKVSFGRNSYINIGLAVLDSDFNELIVWDAARVKLPKDVQVLDNFTRANLDVEDLLFRLLEVDLRELKNQGVEAVLRDWQLVLETLIRAPTLSVINLYIRQSPLLVGSFVGCHTALKEGVLFGSLSFEDVSYLQRYR